MSAVHEALRQLAEVCKLVDFADCAERPELWHKLNAAQQVAEEVLKRPIITDIHCQEFHELAMDYRAARAFSDAPEAYKRLCAYINARIAPVAAQQAVAAVQDNWRVVNNPDGSPPNWNGYVTVEGTISPQPAAAPSGDVERDAALNEAVAALYFNDSSKYEGALWNIVHQLSPSIHELLQADPRAAYIATKE